MSQIRRAVRPIALSVASAAGFLLLTGCGPTEQSSSSDDTTAVQGADEATHNAADVTFATQMIPHHAQALSMADLAIGRDVSADFAKLLDDIRAAQTPEIEMMADWLQEWGEPVPETMRDHAHAGHGDDAADSESGGMSGMPGMMDDSDLEALRKAPAAEFEDLWLTMMIEHHQGAVEMAETELDEGSYGPALDLAEQIRSSQTAEIERMQGMLDG